MAMTSTEVLDELKAAGYVFGLYPGYNVTGMDTNRLISKKIIRCNVIAQDGKDMQLSCPLIALIHKRTGQLFMNGNAHHEAAEHLPELPMRTVCMIMQSADGNADLPEYSTALRKEMEEKLCV